MSGAPAAGRPIWLKGLIGIAFLVAAFNVGVYLYGLTLPDAWKVEESIVVAAPPAAVYPWLATPKRWPDWSTWSKRIDPAAEFTFEGPEAGTDASFAWQGERLGAGSLRITAAEPDRFVSYSLSLGGAGFSDDGRLTLRPTDGGTRVTWTDGGRLGGTLGRLFGDRLQKSVSADFAQSLVGLKAAVEESSASDPESVP